MGRPKLKEAKVPLTIMVRPSVIDEIDRFAKKLELSRSQMTANFIDMGIDDGKILEKLGIVWIAESTGKVLRKLKRQNLNPESDNDEDGDKTI